MIVYPFLKQTKMTNFDKFFTEKIAESVTKETATEEVKDMIVGLYKKVFRKELPVTCKQCFADGFFELYNFWKANEPLFLELFECEYSLRAGVLLQLFGETTDMATKNNITNALAQKHLRANPANIEWFETFPEDWYEKTEEAPVQLEAALEVSLDDAAAAALLLKAEEEKEIPAGEETPAPELEIKPAPEPKKEEVKAATKK